ncbi:unnamed protein product [Trichogramma brassicae]|uniref:Integrase zinc-binding domain-containing protein n=1 Tax=Trichogramma brassicae TaxID=86971 RepID=A0A6H5I198_9HYME|nr:unnamed protein product [Trichogramma brassicae]
MATRKRKIVNRPELPQDSVAAGDGASSNRKRRVQVADVITASSRRPAARKTVQRRREPADLVNILPVSSPRRTTRGAASRQRKSTAQPKRTTARRVTQLQQEQPVVADPPPALPNRPATRGAARQEREASQEEHREEPLVQEELDVADPPLPPPSRRPASRKVGQSRQEPMDVADPPPPPSRRPAARKGAGQRRQEPMVAADLPPVPPRRSASQGAGQRRQEPMVAADLPPVPPPRRSASQGAGQRRQEPMVAADPPPVPPHRSASQGAGQRRQEPMVAADLPLGPPRRSIPQGAAQGQPGLRDVAEFPPVLSRRQAAQRAVQSRQIPVDAVDAMPLSSVYPTARGTSRRLQEPMIIPDFPPEPVAFHHRPTEDPEVLDNFADENEDLESELPNGDFQDAKNVRRAPNVNNETIVNEVLQKYWILGVRKCLRTIVSKCSICKLLRAQPRNNPIMSSLPSARLATTPWRECAPASADTSSIIDAFTGVTDRFPRAQRFSSMTSSLCARSCRHTRTMITAAAAVAAVAVKSINNIHEISACAYTSTIQGTTITQSRVQEIEFITHPYMIRAARKVHTRKRETSAYTGRYIRRYTSQRSNALGCATCASSRNEKTKRLYFYVRTRSSSPPGALKSSNPRAREHSSARTLPEHRSPGHKLRTDRGLCTLHTRTIMMQRPIVVAMPLLSQRVLEFRMCTCTHIRAVSLFIARVYITTYNVNSRVPYVVVYGATTIVARF